MFRRRPTPPEPLLSVVVPVFNVQQYVAECLESLLADADLALQVVVVDDGSPDGSAAVARKFARRDRRVAVVVRENGGLSAARNTGVEHATAPYLTFVDSDDRVNAGGLRSAVESLERSDADYALLPYQQFRAQGDVDDVPPWVARIYPSEITTVTAHEHPELLAQATAWSKVYRRSFWDDARLTFREGVLYEDQEVTARAFAAAGRVDLVPVHTYFWRVRAGSITREASARSIGAFFDAVGLALVALSEVPGARAARASQVLSNDVPRYLRALTKVDDEGYRDRLLAGATTLLKEPDLDLSEAPAEARVVYALLRAGRDGDVPVFVAQGGLDLASLRSDEVDGQPALVFPFAGEVPDEARILSERQTPLDVRVTRAAATDDGVELSVLAYLRHVDGPPESARAWWVEDGFEDEELTVEASPEFVGHRLRTTRAGNEQATWRIRGPLPPRGGLLRIEVRHGRREGSTVLAPPELPPEPDGPGPTATEVTDGGVLVDGVRIPLPAAAGEHVVAAQVSSALAGRLPIDLDRGWLGLDDGRLVWHRLPDVPREQLTVWWQRDHGTAGAVS